MKPRILMVISLFYPCLGGAEQQALRLASNLAKKGFSVEVLTRKLKGLPRFEEIQHIPVYRSIRTFSWGKWFGISYMVSVFWFLCRHRQTYDIIHCHMAQGFHSIVALLLRALLKKKVLIKVSASGPLSDFKTMKKAFLGSSFLKKLKNTDCLITVCSQSTREALQEGFTSSVVVQIPNGVDINFFTPISPNKKNYNTITFIGRLDYMKGVHILIQAFKKLREQQLSVTLDIIGDGPERHKLQRMAAHLGLNNSVTFCGEIQEVVTYLQKSALFVLPTFSEGLSNVLLEAMACALPVIATKVGGNVDLIQDNVNGILVEPRNPDQLFKAMQQILKDQVLAERLGNEARNTVQENFSMAQIVDQYITLYHDLVSPIMEI